MLNVEKPSLSGTLLSTAAVEPQPAEDVLSLNAAPTLSELMAAKAAADKAAADKAAADKAAAEKSAS